MIILCTTILFHVIAKHGGMWEGAAAAWMIAAFMDFFLFGLLIVCSTGHKF